MKMKKTIALLLASVLLLTALAGCGGTTAAPAETTAAPVETAPAVETEAPEETVPVEESVPEETEGPDTTPGIYTVGEKMEDFTVTLSDGTTVSLYELLETKEMVLLNFWATWCGPCKMEFPYMQEAYEKYQDKVAIIALSTDDDSAAIEQFKQAEGLTSLPMAYDEIGLTRKFQFTGIPTSVAIDRFGVVCWQETGAITETDKFERLFAGFLGDKYTKSKADYQIPGPKSTVAAPSDEDLSSALNAEGSTLKFTSSDNPYIWPFLPSADGMATSGCVGVPEAIAHAYTTVTAKAGDVLAFEYRVDAFQHGALVLYVDDQPVAGFSGMAFGTYGYPFEADGTYQITFAYESELRTTVTQDSGSLSNVRLLSGDEAKDLPYLAPAYPKPLKSLSAEFAPMDAEPVVLYMKEDESNQLRGSVFVAQNSPDSVTLKVRLGRNHLPAFAQCYTENDVYFLRDAQFDQEGYYLNADLASGSVIFQFVPDMRKSDFMQIAVCRDENSLNTFVNNYYGYQVGWAYEKDMPAPGAVAAYEITFQDESGNPVSGVAAQICTDEVCNVITSDANGLVAVEDTSISYEVHVLKAPEGYAVPEETFVLSAENSSITITLKKQ